jgi:hypothetical protein
MLRLSTPIGFIAGLFIGIYTRDNYVYPYPLRVQDIQEDYDKLNENINGRIADLEATINKMENELEAAQGVYITRKLRRQ